MKEDIDQMKTPRFQADGMISKHISDVHQGPIVIRGVVSRLETPYAFREYRRYVSYVPDPRIIHNLLLIVIDKITEKRINVNEEGDHQQYQNWDERN